MGKMISKSFNDSLQPPEEFGRLKLVSTLSPLSASSLASVLEAPTSPMSKYDWNSFEEKFRVWLSSLVDVSNFPYVYPTSGILGGLNFLFASHSDKTFYMRNGDFSYVKEVCSRINSINHPPYEKVEKSSVLYLSQPSSIDGKYFSQYKAWSKQFDRVWLDLAYLGTTRNVPRIIPTANTSILLYSLSKSFSLSHLRCGFILSREPIEILDLLLEKSYFNSAVVRAAQKITEQFPPDLAAQKFFSAYDELVAKYSLQPSDSFLIALSCHQMFQFWYNPDTQVTRVPTALAIKYLIGETP